MSTARAPALAAAFKPPATHDSKLDSCLLRFAECEGNAEALLQALRAYRRGLAAWASAGAALADGVLHFYGGTGPAMRARAGRYHASRGKRVGGRIPAKMLKVYDELVVAPAAKWRASLAEAKAPLAGFKAVRATFDHYNKKLEKLRGEHRARQVGGKAEKAKQVQRRTRNEQKAEQARRAYSAFVDKPVKRENGSPNTPEH